MNPIKAIAKKIATLLQNNPSGLFDSPGAPYPKPERA